jgi:cytochrome b subunit of formate dehydrogenase
MNKSNTPPKTEHQAIAYEEHEEEFVRFNVFHRIMHVLVMVSFMGLVFTGAPLKYRNAGWSKVLMSFYDGVHTAGVLHRAFAVITFTYFICEAVYGIVYCFIILRLPIFGPDSMVPRAKDLFDLIGNLKYFFDRGPKPEFDRFTYWEKFDYIAVFWGMIAIGATGLMLAFPDFATLILPGKILNIATIVHSDEALLAAGFIFIVHWYNTHWRPERFPLDPVIFTGRISKEELMHERPAEWKRLVENPELMEKMKVKSK